MLKQKSNITIDYPVISEVQDLVKKYEYLKAVSVLYEHQLESWSLLKEGHDALTSVKTNEFTFDGYEIYTQFNPHRINSTTADISAKGIKNRKCFLCIENLPKEQQGIIYNDKYLILCNPYPVFRGHLTISSIQHKPQRIKRSFKDLLQITKDFNDFCFIYNGPESGASAPDHLHFQAVKKDFLPVYLNYEGLKNGYGEVIKQNSVLISAINDGIRRFLSLESESERVLAKFFNSIYNLYAVISKSHVEPMMNIISTFEEGSGWRILIFFRKKHRPDAYFKENDDNILVSPASIDLGGILITPLEKDFNKIDKDTITQIFREVAAGKEEFEYLKSKIKE